MALFKGESNWSPNGVQETGVHYINYTLKNAEPVTAGNYSTFFIAPVALQILSVSEIHSVASSSGTLDITKDTGTTAPQGGSSIFSTGTFDTSATANTLQTKTNISPTVGRLAAGDRLALKNGGTLTSLANMSVIVTYQVL